MKLFDIDRVRVSDGRVTGVVCHGGGGCLYSAMKVVDNIDTDH